jgi:hypothetical protein
MSLRGAFAATKQFPVGQLLEIASRKKLTMASCKGEFILWQKSLASILARPTLLRR